MSGKRTFEDVFGDDTELIYDLPCEPFKYHKSNNCELVKNKEHLMRKAKGLFPDIDEEVIFIFCVC